MTSLLLGFYHVNSVHFINYKEYMTQTGGEGGGGIVILQMLWWGVVNKRLGTTALQERSLLITGML